MPEDGGDKPVKAREPVRSVGFLLVEGDELEPAQRQYLSRERRIEAAQLGATVFECAVV